MTIRFALAEGRLRPRLSRAGARAAVSPPANDNAPTGFDAGAERAMLDAALRQFSQHGIGAAAHARHRAEKAFFAGDSETYRWWLGVCRTLDRRMANVVANRADAIAEAKPR
ncbi:MAG: hypothetical protein P0Y56_03610 [Candidatus Andeanibacterium colombiense]|uniref:Uncharacterized protein n=1 Tax=Candidatus Andeanibacterium colombiense TaxID=3121345 RepID=A0AAJ5X431_9SPHN|nr:MAG: hypothetical protein P0Y56_03610 [Sphingomonadaceae bacterium]